MTLVALGWNLKIKKFLNNQFKSEPIAFAVGSDQTVSDTKIIGESITII